jgi:hypothetical protein
MSTESHTALQKIAYYLGRQDEEPNKELARELVESGDSAGIRSIAGALEHEVPQVRSDCIKVLYEIGYLDPSRIVDFALPFLDLLQSKNNRLVWGAMIALSTIARLEPDLLCEHYDRIARAMKTGSVITLDAGVKVLAALAAYSRECAEPAFAYLLQHLAECRPKDVPQRAESAALGAARGDVQRFIATLEARSRDLSDRRLTRVRKVIARLTRDIG